MKGVIFISEKQKNVLLRIIVSAVLLIGLFFVPVKGIMRLTLYLIPYLIIGYDVLLEAAEGVLKRELFDENFLMALATVGAIVLGIIGRGDYTEAIAVMLFYQTGELFQSYAVTKSRKNITELMDIRPDYANIEKNGELIKANPNEVEIGSVIVIKAGEKVPIDGVVISGNSTIDTSALTGESIPREVSVGDNCLSGCININGLIKIQTTKKFSDSTVSKIMDLVENASSNKAKSENFITKFARVYTPIVCYSALALAILPPLISLAFGAEANIGVWLYRALTFLVASCPCALVIGIPLSFFAGLGGASKAGILIKGSSFIETLCKTDCVVFDKTGTLTEGVFRVNEIHSENLTDKQLLEYAAFAECNSSHPISASIISAYGKPIDRERITSVREISGKGIIAKIDNKEIAVGNEALMEELGVEFGSSSSYGTTVHICIDKHYEGRIAISDKIKPSSKEAVAALKNSGIMKTVMLTGDNKEVAESVGTELGIGEIYSELLPDGKVEAVKELKNQNLNIAFVGDGINDAPVLAISDIGIAMGALGSDSAIEAADVVLMDDDPKKISLAIRIAKRIIRIVHSNIGFAIAVKVISLILVALGLAGMWLAIFADVGVMVIAVLNAMRALVVPKR